MSKKSPIWLLSKNELQQIIDDSISFKMILENLKSKSISIAFSTLKECLIKNDIDFSNILLNWRTNSFRKKPLKDILVKNSDYKRSDLKNRLVSEKLLEYKCIECGIENEWNNKKLVLQIDHINGIPNDNTLENLRFLCPNCHSQTETFAGRALRKPTFGKPPHKLNNKKCSGCKKIICDDSVTCTKCRSKKINWPPLIEIENMLKTMPMVAVAKKLGVSDNAVKKHMAKLKIK